MKTLSDILKELYSDKLWRWYDVKGSKEEILVRLKGLSDLEKVMVGIEDE